MFQWPGVGVGAFSISAWMTVGHAGGERLAQRRAQFVRRLDADAAGAVGAGERGVVHAVGLAAAFEQAAEAVP